MKIKAIITGTTGMVGKAVLLECLEHPDVESVLVINRKSIQLNHPKLKEIIHADFFDLTPIQNELTGYNVCFFCLGVSAMGMNEKEYTKYTYELTTHFAKIVAQQNPEMTFNYVSGTGTDSTEKGNIMWARVKGKTENALLTMPFKNVYLFRPGIILPEKGVKSKVSWYQTLYVLLKPFYPLFRQFKSVTTSSRVGKAMINSVLKGYSKKHLDNTDINELAKG
ncbi:MAG: NAD-dependent epimerase/dehydratase family protein [Vicingus serpentipes]|nr:NAD-dependent epimerase/dehydratase family protein [Vicingus serpentipes]